MPTLDHLGVRYHWRRVGQGPQPAVFLHCSMASGKVWVPMMTGFADILTSRAIDMPAHGGTGPANPDVDLQVQAAGAAIRLIEQTESPVHLVGHSYGATIALRIAHERPDLVRSLVLIEPVFFAVLDDTDHPAFAPLLRGEQETIDLIRSGEPLAAMEKFMTRWASPGDWQRLDRTTRAELAARVGFLETVRDSILSRNDTRLQLCDISGIKTPTLLIRGDQGQEVIGHVNDTLAQVMPNAQAISIAAAGHMVPLTHMAPVASVLRDFWDQQKQNSGAPSRVKK